MSPLPYPMRSDFHYNREHVIDVDAAVVGVSRARWASLTPDEAAAPDRARQIMAERQFDLMPVDGSGDEVRHYVKTTGWGRFDEDVEQHAITPADVIPQRTPLEEVIRAFGTSERDFFFLSSYGRITGLITVVNLNCRQARVFLYGLFCELEMALGDLLQDRIQGGHLTEETVLSDVPEKVQKAYAEDRANGVDQDIVEYLYLSNLITLFRKHQLYEALGYDSSSSFKKPFNRLVKLRDTVAHPVRSLVTAPDDAEKLWRDVSLVEGTLSRLRALAMAPARLRD